MSDTLDASDTFSGAMALLQNLIPDPTTKQVWQCRPAQQQLINFSTQGGPFSSGFSSGFQLGFSQLPIGLISVLRVYGNFAFGMVATARNPGHDEPFCFNLLTNTFVMITAGNSAIDAAHTPLSPPAAGAWTPPCMALIGPKVMLTHSGFPGGGVYFGWIDISNPAAPTWNTGNLTGAVSFTVVPTWVAQFNGRAYYIHNLAAQPAVIFSDSLNPTNCTNANQVLTFGDNVALTAIGGLQLDSQLGGVVQSLMVFKGVANVYQITGDSALSSLSINALNIATGTLAPNSLVSTPKGLAFIAPDGLRIIDFDGHVQGPLGYDGQGTTVPFANAVVPSRISAGCNGTLLRASVQNGAKAGSPNEEYWYDFVRSIWYGPMTFAPGLIQPWQKTFITAPIDVLGSLWQSDSVQSSTSTYVENGMQLTWTAQTPYLPDDDRVGNVAVTESLLTIAFGVGTSIINVSAFNQNGSVINQVQLQQATSVTTWGSFTWGQAVWGGTVNNLTTYFVPWTKPIVADRIAFSLQGVSAQGVKIGTMKYPHQRLRYLASSAAAA